MTEDRQVFKAVLNCLYFYYFDESARLKLYNLINEIKYIIIIK